MPALFDEDPVVDAEIAARRWAEQHGYKPVTETEAARWLDEADQRRPERYFGRHVRADENTGWCTNPIGHHDAWRSSELCAWEEANGIYRTKPGMCNQCGKGMP